jgi:hypothetical protein
MNDGGRWKAVGLIALATTALSIRDASPQATVSSSQRAARAQEARSEVVRQGTLAGHVLSSADSQPIFGARVQVAGRLGELLTDQAGWFELSLPGGTYDLTFHALGYAPRQLHGVQISAEPGEPLTVFMTPAPLRLSEIVVTPSTFGILEAQVVAVPQTRTLEELTTYPHFGEDLYRAVNRLPGIATHDIKAKLHIRGSPDDQVLQTLDGLELYEPFHLKDVDGALSIIDVESVSDVELSTGGFTAEYGDKLAGVFAMNTTTPPPDRMRTTLGMSLMNLTFKNEGSFAGGTGTWLASARRGYLDFLLKLMDDSSTISPTYYDAFTKIQYQLGSNHLISGHLLYAGDKWRGEDDDDWTSVVSSWSSTYAWLNWDAQFSNALSATTIWSIGRLRRHRDAADYFGNREENPVPPEQELDVRDHSGFEFAGLKQDWRYLASDRLLVRWGFDVKTIAADYDYFRWRKSFLPNTTEPFGPDFWSVVDTVAVVENPSGQEVGLYLSNRIRLATPLTAELGLRHDYHSHTGEHTLAPRINIAVQATPTTTLRAAWGWYYQSQGVYELFVADADSSFYPAERAAHWILGLEQRLPCGIAVRAEAYQRRTADPRPEYRTVIAELEQLPEESADNRVLVDATSGSARGIELFVKRDVGQRLAWNLSYGWAIAEEQINGQWTPRPFDQRHTLRAELLFRPTRNWTLSWAFQYHSGWPTTLALYDTVTLATGGVAIRKTLGPINANRLPYYSRMDARISRHFSLGRGRLSLFLDMFNVLGRRNAEAWDYYLHLVDGRPRIDQSISPMLGRLPTFGARWEF